MLSRLGLRPLLLIARLGLLLMLRGLGLDPLLVLQLRLGLGLGLGGGLGALGGVGLDLLLTLLLAALARARPAPLTWAMTRARPANRAAWRTPKLPRPPGGGGRFGAGGGRGGDHRSDAGRIGLPLGALLLQGRHLLRLLLGALVVHAPPVGIALLLGRPLLLRREHAGATGAPVTSVGGLPLLVDGGGVEVAAAVQVSRRDLQGGGRVVGIGPAVAVIDLDQVAVVVGVGVVRVAHQVGIVAVAAVVVVALAVRGVLDHPVVAIAGAPDPGPRAVVVDGVVRRAVAQGVAHEIGVIDIAVDRTRRGRQAPDRRRGRQRVGIGRRRFRRRRRISQRQAGDRCAGGGRGGLLVARGEHQARGGGGQEDVAVRHDAETHHKLRRSERGVENAELACQHERRGRNASLFTLHHEIGSRRIDAIDRCSFQENITNVICFAPDTPRHRSGSNPGARHGHPSGHPLRLRGARAPHPGAPAPRHRHLHRPARQRPGLSGLRQVQPPARRDPARRTTARSSLDIFTPPKPRRRSRVETAQGRPPHAAPSPTRRRSRR